VHAEPSPDRSRGCHRGRRQSDPRGDFDLYAPFSVEPAPCIAFVHGPVGADKPHPRDWPVYQGYGQLAAQSGLVAVVADIEFEDWRASELPTQTLRTLVECVRQHEVVDRERPGALGVLSRGTPRIALAFGTTSMAQVCRLDVPGHRAHPKSCGLSRRDTGQVITVAGGRHGFDFLDPGAESEDAVIPALSSVQRSLRA
jgi:hypothetical protein